MIHATDDTHRNGEMNAVEIDQVKYQHYLQQAQTEQNLLMGILGGFGAAFLGAAIWAAITVATGYQIGWMAIGLGFLVGITIRKLGKGIDTVFGFSGAVLSLAGCLFGNLLAICMTISRQEGILLLDLLNSLTPAIAIRLMKATFNPIDVLFYGIAVYEGYRLSFRQVTADEMAKIVKPKSEF